MQTIAVQDANILIDLVKIGLLDRCLALPYSFTTTNIIFDELIEEQASVILPHIRSGKFSVVNISIEELSEILQLSQEDNHLSEQDWSAYYYAKKENSFLLTGDKRLRQIAKEKGIIVCGIFWILDQLVLTGIISKKEACNYLRDLNVKNKRLPQNEYDVRVNNWCNS